MVVLFRLTFSFYLINIILSTCDNHITHFVQNNTDAVIINFSSYNILKLQRSVQCNSSSPLLPIDGCFHSCTELGYGQDGKISITMQHDNGTMEYCSVDYTIPLQAPSLAYLNIIDNKVRLGINRPIGSFDYVEIHCSDNTSYIIFNTTLSLNDLIVTVDCSFIPNMPLMSFVLKTMKKDFIPAVNGISREVPLPISFTHSINERLLTVIANSPPSINTDSTYEFQLFVHDQMNENIIYELMKISNLNSKTGSTSSYGLIPDLKYSIIFKHLIPSIGYSRSNMTILPISTISYPFPVTNVHLKEEFNNIILNWNDTHQLYDSIEYIVLCNSNTNSIINVRRNTTCICEQMTFNETTILSIQTRIVIPGYKYDRIATVQINTTQIPDIPVFNVINTTENSINIKWNWTNQSLISNLFRYKINCSLEYNSTEIDIQSNEYQCQSLIPGTLYIITMFLENIDETIQRSKSLYANTLLQKCEYREHFYSPHINGNRSIIIEWSPPNQNFDQIYVHCPSSYITFESFQIMPIMLIRCIVTNGIEFTVTFVTSKSGYGSRILQFTDIPPIDLTTTTTTTERPTTTTSERPTTTTSERSPTTTSERSPTTTSARSPTTTSERSPTTTSERPPTTTSARPPSTVTSNNSSDELITTQIALTRWRTAAIIAFIIIGFLILITICLVVLSILFCSRNRYDKTDE